jgi:hypothetical protein
MEGWGELARPLNRVFQKKTREKNIRYCLFLILTHFGFEPVLPTPPSKNGKN